MRHGWSFFRAGGVNQVALTTGADLVNLADLDQKLWVALACPVAGLEFDERTLSLIDTDGDKRVLASELIGATMWAGSVLSDLDVLTRSTGVVELSAIDAATDEGKTLHDTAQALLESLGKGDQVTISVEDAMGAIDSFNAEPLNGDGIVVVESGANEALGEHIAEILAATPEPPTDRCGRPGIDAASVDAFYSAIAARAEWINAGTSAEVRVLGDATAAASGALAAVRGKVDDFFARCRVAAFDPRALEAVNRQQEEYLVIAANDLKVTAQEIAHFPVALVEPGRNLPLVEGINPAWDAAMAALRDQVATPLGVTGDSIDEPTWAALSAKFSAYESWAGAEAGSEVAALPDERVLELNSGVHRPAIDSLIERDAAEMPMANAIEAVERLTRYARDLLPLANNFVAFRDFYSRTQPATFQVGTLYIDQRACELCIRVNDAAKHAKMAPLSSAYLMYCDCSNAEGGKMSIVAAMTDGDVDNLMVGRNGVFYDRDGNDWDATITKIIENPISIRQAFWSPYKRFLRAIEGMIAARAEAAEAKSKSRVDAAAATAKGATEGPTPIAAKPIDVGMVAALGVAVGGIAAAIGLLLEAFFGLGMWMPLGVLGLILLISGPSMVVAWLKLRQRNLGPLLDANGWAVNAQAKVNVPLGKSLTSVAKLPKGAPTDLRDPFAQKGRPWWLYILVIVVLGLAVGWFIGKLDPFLPGPAKSVTVLGEMAPAANKPEAPVVVVPEDAAPAE